MENRHLLEECLDEAIQNHWHERANDLIDMLLRSQPKGEYNPPSLTHGNAKKKSFLFIAIGAKNIRIATRLLQLQKHLPEIIFGKDIAGRTLFHVAAQSNVFVNFIDDLVHVTTQLAAEQGEEDYKRWLHPDSGNFTPIVVAVYFKKYKMIEKFHQLIMREDNAQLIINQQDRNGQVLLHYLIGSKIENPRPLMADFFNLLMNYNASFHVRDSFNFTPFDLYCQQTYQVQLRIFKSLEEKNKKTMLSYYHAKLHTDTSNEPLKKIYFDITKLYNLKSYLIARFEFDKRFPLKECYRTYQVKSETKEEIIIFPTKISLIWQDNKYAVLQKMPRYSARLFSHKSEKVVSDGKVIEQRLKKIFPEHTEHNIESSLELMISVIERYLSQLSQKPVIYPALSIVISLIVFIFDVFLCKFLKETAEANPYYEHRGSEYAHLDCNQPKLWPYSAYRGSYCIETGWIKYGHFAIVCVLASIALAGKLVHTLWNKQPIIEYNDWRPLIDAIEKSILSREPGLTGDDAIKTQEIVANLKADIGILKGNQPMQKVLGTFRDILSNLKALRDGMRSSKVVKLNR